ncbi:MAG: phosphotransferase family protein [Rhodospirillaceae bacterium]|nr:phosphotransferase family protein [Rhodospirillaceae bacterium]
MSDDVTDTLLEIPLFKGRAADHFSYERLGGLTNRNFRIGVEGEKDSYMLRIAGEGTGEYIDRKAEEVCARVTAKAGINAEVLYFDAANGVQLTRYIDGAVTMNSQLFKDLGAVARAGQAFRKLHDCGENFSTEFNIFTMMDEYLTMLREKNAWIPDDYEKTQTQAEAVRAALARAPAPLVPCHCDPLAENFLDTGARMYVIDWEYSGNNDAMWDLGDLSVEAEFGPAQDKALLEAYFDGPPPPDKHARMVMYKAMCDLLWTLWGAIQVANDNPAENFTAYAEGRFENCKKLMASGDFKSQLAVLTG